MFATTLAGIRSCDLSRYQMAPSASGQSSKESTPEAARIYQLNPVALAALRDQLDTYWRRALSSYAEVVSDGIQGAGDRDDRHQREDNP
jgi:hypothetical protein